ncbi:MAG: hypothetical protein EA350_07440 [Gemmatimonadales bacterium]|nr:MAG: hypothetical protein EA350_07440 [Gemmatimonadales bacterium]
MTNAAGQGVAGVTVTWEVTTGGGSIEPVDGGATAGSGEAHARWTLGTGAGQQEARARVTGLPGLAFTADARAGSPALLELEPASGARIAVFGGAFAEPLQLRLEDLYGNPVQGFAVDVEVTAGGGWTTDVPLTDAQGTASFHWYTGPGPAPEEQRLRVRAGTGDLLAANAVGLSEAPAPGAMLEGHRGFVEYTAGTLPFIITAGHGGTLLPGDIPDRSPPATLVRDLDTDILALLVADSLEALTGERPHLIRVHLHRRKMDANRDLAEAAQGNPEATRTWKEFHSWTETAMAGVRASHPRGLYVDVHGHGHDVQRLELGYLLTGAQLAVDDHVLDGSGAAGSMSLREIAAWTGRTPSRIVRGEGSLGDLFHRRGYPAVPSPQDLHPAGAPFFSGGYNTRRYGCGDGGTICGFQLEANRIGVRDSEAALGRFAGATARVLLEYWADVTASGAGRDTP